MPRTVFGAFFERLEQREKLSEIMPPLPLNFINILIFLARYFELRLKQRSEFRSSLHQTGRNGQISRI